MNCTEAAVLTNKDKVGLGEQAVEHAEHSAHDGEQADPLGFAPGLTPAVVFTLAFGCAWNGRHHMRPAFLPRLPHPALTIGLFFCLLFAPMTLKAQTEDPPSIARTLVDSLARDDFSGAVAPFDARMRIGLSEEKLREVWKSLRTRVGELQGVGPARQERQGGFAVVFIPCQFERAALDVKVVLNGAGQVSGLFFQPAAPATMPPPEIIERAAMVGTGEWTLPGTLTLPAREATDRWPAIVLVHGSGPHDRDETVGAVKPFRDLAWGLAARGVAVLRYEKRSYRHPTKVAALAGLTVKEEIIDDALAAVELLRRTPGVDAARIFVLGHSLGGTVAPRIAQAEPRLAGLVILAGATRPLEDIMLEQTRYLCLLDGSISAEEQVKLDALTAEVSRLKNLTPADSASKTTVLGAPPSYWLDLRGYDAAAVARTLPQRLLVLQGGRDYQVTTAEFAGWQRALDDSARATLRIFPELNHLFVSGQGRSSPAEYGQPGHVAPEVIEAVAVWLLET